MASGREMLVDDLPPELLNQPHTGTTDNNWEQSLRNWADQQLTRGVGNLVDLAVPISERVALDIALQAQCRPLEGCGYTAGRGPERADPEDGDSGERGCWIISIWQCRADVR